MKTAKIQALEKQIQSGNIKTLHAKILRYARQRRGFFIMELQQILSIARSTATARVSELEDMGLVKYVEARNVGFAKDKQGYFKAILDEEGQKRHRWIRRSKKYNRWLNTGIEEGWLDTNLNVIR